MCHSSVPFIQFISVSASGKKVDEKFVVYFSSCCGRSSVSTLPYYFRFTTGFVLFICLPRRWLYKYIICFQVKNQSFEVSFTIAKFFSNHDKSFYCMPFPYIFLTIVYYPRKGSILFNLFF